MSDDVYDSERVNRCEMGEFRAQKRRICMKREIEQKLKKIQDDNTVKQYLWDLAFTEGFKPLTDIEITYCL